MSTWVVVPEEFQWGRTSPEVIYTPFTEKGAEYYDRIYTAGYSTSAYRPVYDAVLDFLERFQGPSVLEVGCGTGDLGLRIRDLGVPYRGFDISQVAVDSCRKYGLNVRLGSAYEPGLFEPRDYSVIIALEVFEHLDDRRVVGLFPAGTHVLFSVPDFVETSHLRAYQDADRDIVEYYRGLLAVGQILPFRFTAADGHTLTIRLAHAVAGAEISPNPLSAQKKTAA